MKEVLNWMDGGKAIVIAVTCPRCHVEYNAIFQGNSLTVTPEDGSGDEQQVAYTDMECAKCGFVFGVEIDRLTTEEEAKLPRITLRGTQFKDMPVYMGRCVRAFDS